MVKEIIFTVSESLDGGYEASAVGHSIYTQCDEYSELNTTLRDAVRCHFDEEERPSLIRIHFVRNEVIADLATAKADRMAGYMGRTADSVAADMERIIV
ncbi:MAG: hypothetical protein FWG87_04085 [Defluviitaleaceae bacterium]|nr:hypothetical protein [Defluviitaleaceae bacterium]